jgi:clan AA aspartic protease
VTSNGEERQIRAIMDTAFTGYLTLPRADKEVMGLRYRNDMRATMADGRIVVTSTHAATVRWESLQRPILVLSMEAPPLLGMALLNGHRLAMDVIDGGRLTITPLP